MPSPRACAIAPTTGSAPQLHALLGLAYLRQAEVLNCVEQHNAECWVFPLRGGGVHTITEPAEKAFEHYLAYLEAQPDDLRRLSA